MGFATRQGAAVPDGFAPVSGEGFANEVFVNEQDGVVLKVYARDEYYAAELLAFGSGFVRMPSLLERGKLGGRPYILMSRIGDSAPSPMPLVPSLVDTVALLHETKTSSRSSAELYFARYFSRIAPHGELLRQSFGIDASRLIMAVRRAFCAECSVLSFVHGDITNSNARNVGKTLYLIDFDEAGYALPEWEFAKLFWSDIGGVNDSQGLAHFIDSYNMARGTRYAFDSRLRLLVLLAGADFWLWRRLHLRGHDDMLQSAFERLASLVNAYAS